MSSPSQFHNAYDQNFKENFTIVKISLALEIIIQERVYSEILFVSKLFTTR